LVNLGTDPIGLWRKTERLHEVLLLAKSVQTAAWVLAQSYSMAELASPPASKHLAVAGDKSHRRFSKPSWELGLAEKMP
jgi:hypothetical protein